MRTFFKWDLLKRIEANPVEYIVQRKVSLLWSYESGYYFCKNWTVEETQQNKYEDIPDFNEYIAQLYPYKYEKMGTRNSLSIVRLQCEYERAYYETYFRLLYQYEETYPIKEELEWIPVPKTDTLKQNLSAMKKRYGMFFGSNNSLESLRAFLDGYYRCKKEHGLPLNTYENRVQEFLNSITNNITDSQHPMITWDRKYTYNHNWCGWGEENEEKTAENPK